MISLILLKLFTFSQILQGVPKLSHATVYTCPIKTSSIHYEQIGKNVRCHLNVGALLSLAVMGFNHKLACKFS